MDTSQSINYKVYTALYIYMTGTTFSNIFNEKWNEFLNTDWLYLLTRPWNTLVLALNLKCDCPWLHSLDLLALSLLCPAPVLTGPRGRNTWLSYTAWLEVSPVFSPELHMFLFWFLTAVCFLLLMRLTHTHPHTQSSDPTQTATVVYDHCPLELKWSD